MKIAGIIGLSLICLVTSVIALSERDLNDENVEVKRSPRNLPLLRYRNPDNLRTVKEFDPDAEALHIFEKLFNGDQKLRSNDESFTHLQNESEQEVKKQEFEEIVMKIIKLIREKSRLSQEDVSTLIEKFKKNLINKQTHILFSKKDAYEYLQSLFKDPYELVENTKQELSNDDENENSRERNTALTEEWLELNGNTPSALRKIYDSLTNRRDIHETLRKLKQQRETENTMKEYLEEKDEDKIKINSFIEWLNDFTAKKAYEQHLPGLTNTLENNNIEDTLSLSKPLPTSVASSTNDKDRLFLDVKYDTNNNVVTLRVIELNTALDYLSELVMNKMLEEAVKKHYYGSSNWLTFLKRYRKHLSDDSGFESDQQESRRVWNLLDKVHRHHSIEPSTTAGDEASVKVLEISFTLESLTDLINAKLLQHYLVKEM